MERGSVGGECDFINEIDNCLNIKLFINEQQLGPERALSFVGIALFQPNPAKIN